VVSGVRISIQTIMEMSSLTTTALMIVLSVRRVVPGIAR